MRKICSTVLLVALCLCLCSCKSSDYSKAMEQFESGEYQKAKEAFLELADYEDSAEMVRMCDYRIATELMEKEKYQEALQLFQALGDYKDSAEQSVICVCTMAEALAEKGNLQEAVALLADFYQYPRAEELFCTILLNEATDHYLPNVEQAQESWNEYLLIWMKNLQAVANKTRVGQAIDIPKVDYSAPQIISLQRSMEKANKSVALIREAYSEEVLQICREDVRNLVHTMLESAEVIDKQFQNLDSWATTMLFYGIQDKNASKANSKLIQALYDIEDAVEIVTDNRK